MKSILATSKHLYYVWRKKQKQKLHFIHAHICDLIILKTSHLTVNDKVSYAL